jgi:hypothetical protein
MQLRTRNPVRDDRLMAFVRRVAAVDLLAFGASLTGCSTRSATQAPRPLPAQLVARAIIASGGTAALQSPPHEVQIGYFVAGTGGLPRYRQFCYRAMPGFVRLDVEGDPINCIAPGGGWEYECGVVRPLDVRLRPGIASYSAWYNAECLKLARSQIEHAVGAHNRVLSLDQQTIPGGALCDVVEARAPDGSRREYYFGCANHRLCAVGFRAEGSDSTREVSHLTCFEDWRRRNGAMIPYSTRIFRKGKFEGTFRTALLDLQSPLPASIFKRPQVTWRGARTTVPIEYFGLPIVRASLNGGRLRRFLIDTGASYTQLTSETAKALRLRAAPVVTPGPQASPLSTPIYPLVSVRVGAVSAADVQSCVLTGKEDVWYRSSGLSGALGTSFLARFQVTLDCGARRLTLGAPGEMPASAPLIPFKIRSGQPWVQVNAGGHIMELQLDTGANSTWIPHSAIGRVPHGGTLDDGPRIYSTGVLEEYEARVPILQVGKVRVSHFPVRFFGVAHIRQDDWRALEAPVGTTFLERFRVTLDYILGRMTLSKSRGEPFADSLTSPGLDIGDQAPGPYPTLNMVVPGTPAAAAGLQLGDAVVKMNGQHTAGIPIWILGYELRGAPGSDLDLTIRHRGQIRNYHLRRVRLLDPGAKIKS